MPNVNVFLFILFSFFRYCWSNLLNCRTFTTKTTFKVLFKVLDDDRRITQLQHGYYFAWFAFWALCFFFLLYSLHFVHFIQFASNLIFNKNLFFYIIKLLQREPLCNEQILCEWPCVYVGLASGRNNLGDWEF